MSTNDTAALQGAAPTVNVQPIERRSLDALTRCMTVLPDEGAAAGVDGLYTVVSDSGKAYVVDVREGTCECPDHEYRKPSGGCIHRRRVAFAIGAEPVPVGLEGVDPRLGEHIDAEPRVAATDGGTAEVGVDAEAETDGRDDDRGRPDDCACHDVDAGLPCWACFRDGFDAPNPAEPAADVDGEGR